MERQTLITGALLICFATLSPNLVYSESTISDATQECIGCHSSVTPGIVADWKRSRHAKIAPGEALAKSELNRRVSASNIPEPLSKVVVGCAECHQLNIESHKDSFNHIDQKVHLTVTPRDCAVCHSEENIQYDKNLMSHARINLANNPLFSSLVANVNGTHTLKDMKAVITPANEKTEADSCFHCHGTDLKVKGSKTRDTDFGEMEFPVIEGWPNQGVGRFNPDGSKGSCSSCHSRHEFSIVMARKPYTCSQCHKGPDVPAYKAYEVSKHSNMFSSLWSDWNFKEVPWTVGKDFTAPTCAVCHVSLVVDDSGQVVSKRTHQMNDRLPWRILGLIYAHPHPKSPDTSIIRNKQGQPLPVSLDGELASEFLISPEEQQKRTETLHKVCLSCHSKDWVDGQWSRVENTLETSNQMTKTATEIISKAWEEDIADPKVSLFDEFLEKQWVQQWLFYANSTRFASAMMGADYGVFANGRWYLTKNIQAMLDHYNLMKGLKDNSGSAVPKQK